MEDSVKSKGASWTLTVPTSRESDCPKLTFHLRDITEEVFMGAKALMDARKEFEAVRMIIKALLVEGDDPEILRTNFIAMNSAVSLITELIIPVEGELKKN